MDDLVIGAVMNYTYEKIAPWLHSLKETGYSGKIALVVYTMDNETKQKLIDEGVTLFIPGSSDEQGNITYPGIYLPHFNIMVERFAHIWYFLTNIEADINKVLITDVGDVIFQTNPSNNMDLFGLSIGGENLKYKDEVWSKNNMLQSFGPVLLKEVEDKEIICAGVLGGDFTLIRGLCMLIWLTCRGSSPHTPGGGGPDQAALNLVLSSLGLDNESYDSNFAVHLGTHSEAIKSGSGDIGLNYVHNGVSPFDKFIREEAKIVEVGGRYTILNELGASYPIVHQYNRIPKLREYYTNVYKDKNKVE